MKRILILVLSVICLAGCKKDLVAVRDSLIGTWELRTSSGTIAGYVHTFAPENGNLITFLDNTHYKSTYVSADTSFTASGTYKLSEGSDCSGNKVVLLSYPPGAFSSAIYISGDTLHIDDNCISEGVYNQFQKIR